MADKKKLSVALIAHNEAEIIEPTLQSVNWVDEIIIVDAGSTDNTVEVCRRYDVEVLLEENQVNLNINKNIAIDNCSGEWILVLDADEVIPDELAGLIRKIVNDSNSADGYLIPRKNFVLGRWVRRGSQYPDYQLRLFRKGKGRFPAVHVHERLKVDGKVEKLDTPFEHHPYRDIAMLNLKNKRYVEFEAQHRFKIGSKVSGFKLFMQVTVLAPTRFIRRYIFKGGFLDGTQGIMMAWFDLSNNIQRWFRLWELNQQAKRGQ